jgi:hypothetical protein
MKNIFFVVIASFFITSCATVKQSIDISPIPQTTPTSASNSLIVNGKIVKSDQYSIIKDFSIEKTELINRKTNTGIISFASDLENLRQQNKADAIVDFKLQFISANQLNTNLILIERCVGFLGLTGVLYGVGSYITPSSSASYNRQALVPGAITAITFFGGSILHEYYSKIKYKYVISGKLVKLNNNP